MKLGRKKFIVLGGSRKEATLHHRESPHFHQVADDRSKGQAFGQTLSWDVCERGRQGRVNSLGLATLTNFSGA